MVIAASGEPAPELSTLAIAGGAGAVGVAGLGALYRGLAIGAMAVVAPIAALGAAIPVGVGVATGDSLGALQGVGIALALGGVALVAREEAPEGGGAQDGGGRRPGARCGRRARAVPPGNGLRERRRHPVGAVRGARW